MKNLLSKILCLLFVLSLFACSIVSQANSTEKPLPPTMAVQTSTPVTSIKYQLTYVASQVVNNIDYVGIFARDVQCIGQPTLCFGDPELLLKIPKQKGENFYIPYGEIDSYSWSPDGKKIAFCAIGQNERWDIFVSDWNGDNLENITKSPDDECFPSWSIDNHLTYTVCAAGRCHAVISSEDGKQLTKLPINDIQFTTWMPDGKNILFVGEDNNAIYQIFITNLDGTDVKQITHAQENNILPDLTTNGSSIFFTKSQTYKNSNFNSNIFSTDLQGAVESPLTTDKALLSGGTTVAPFGSWIAFIQGRKTYSIYVVNFDGKAIFQVADGKNNENIPGWRTIITP